MIVLHLGKKYKLVYSTDRKFNDLVKTLKSLKRKRIK